VALKYFVDGEHIACFFYIYIYISIVYFVLVKNTNMQSTFFYTLLSIALKLAT